MKMREIKTTVYSFGELSEEAQEQALANLRDINVTGYDWWNGVYEDGEEIGLKITGFDIDRGAYCKGDFIGTAKETADAIIINHGDMTDTYKTAKDYLDELAAFEADPENYYDYGTDDEELRDHDDIDDEFLRALLEDYRIMLSKEYDYLTSDESVKDTIEANGYEFTEDGKFSR
jgi:hypothetical protein